MMRVDGSDLRAILDLLGAPATPTPDSERDVAEIETWLGRPLPEETRQFLLTPVALAQPGHPHSQVSIDFMGGLPDVAAFLDSFSNSDQGRFNAAVHFLGLYPIGKRLQHGNPLFAMAPVEPHTDFRFGGVLYYDQKEVGAWGATISEFLLRAIDVYCKACEVAASDFESGEGIDPGRLRDCFSLQYDWRDGPPEPEPLPRQITRNWEERSRALAKLTSRSWIVDFLNDDLGPQSVAQLPTLEQWEEQRALVGNTHHDAMYWLLAHALLDNRTELDQCAALISDNPSRLAKAVAQGVSQPGFGDKWAERREKVYQLAREAFISR